MASEIRCYRTDCKKQYNVKGWTFGECACSEITISSDGVCLDFESRTLRIPRVGPP